MTLNLPEALEESPHAEVCRGRFASADEAIAEPRPSDSCSAGGNKDRRGPGPTPCSASSGMPPTSWMRSSRTR